MQLSNNPIVYYNLEGTQYFGKLAKQYKQGVVDELTAYCTLFSPGFLIEGRGTSY